MRGQERVTEHEPARLDEMQRVGGALYENHLISISFTCSSYRWRSLMGEFLRFKVESGRARAV